jgi:HK97 family phage portal protein
MGLLDFFRSPPAPAVRAEPPVTASLQSEAQWKGLAVPGVPSRAGLRVDEKAALSLPATMQALRVLTGVFAMTPLIYYRRDASGRQRASGSPLFALMHDRPNLHQSAFAFKELLFADILLTGNFFAYVSRDGAGRPVALTRLKPWTVVIAETFDRAEGITLFFDATLPDGTRERFPARDIWHVAGMSRDGLAGLNPLAYARDAIGGAIATERFTADFWGNGGRPTTVLTTKGKVDPATKERIRQDWHRLHGPGGSQTAVLDQDMDVKFASENMEASQFIETRGFQVVDLARIWGVPPHLIFDLSRATFSNIEHQSLEFVTYHLGPHYERVASAATRQFAEAEHYFEHLTDALVKGDLKSRMEAYRLQRDMGVANANEIRRRENEPDIPGDAGTEYWRPMNMGRAGDPVEPRGPGVRIQED